MEEKAFFTAKEREQLFALYKRLLQLSGDTLQKGDCHKLKIHLIKAVAEGNLPRNCFGMNPIIKDMQTAVIVAEEIGMKRASILGIMLHESVKNHLCTLASVQQEYGEDVAGIIRGLVKINELYSKSPTIESENFRNLLLSFAEDMRVILIIIADRVNLMRQIKETPNIEASSQRSCLSVRTAGTQAGAIQTEIGTGRPFLEIYRTRRILSYKGQTERNESLP